jgi:hypothetical protein
VFCDVFMKDSLQRCVTNGLGELQRVTIKRSLKIFALYNFSRIDHAAKARSRLYWSNLRLSGINCKLGASFSSGLLKLVAAIVNGVCKIHFY